MFRRAVVSFTVFAFCCIIAALASAEELHVTLKRPALTSDAPSKLSPMLIATKDAGGVLRGTDAAGQPIISLPEANRPRLTASAVVRAVAPAPAEYSPVALLKISYKPGAKPTAGELEKTGLREVEDYARGSFLLAEPFNKVIDAALANRLAEEPKVQRVTPSFRARAIPPKTATERQSQPAAMPPTNDPKWNDLWGMRNIHAPDAWKKVHDSPSVVVAVIDTGVNYEHEDLALNKWSNAAGKHGHDYVENDDDPMDKNGHGTHCAGTIGGVGNNMKGVVGVSWKIQIMGVRWLDKDGYGEVANAIKCIDFAIDNKAQILSNSWFWTEDDPDLDAAIKRAAEKKILFVAAASNFAERPGNNGGDNDKLDTLGRYPSAYPHANILAVAAIDEGNGLASFSNWGKSTVDIGAPGVLIMSTVLGNGYDGTYSGTSMATPHVAGAAALILAKDPNASDAEIKKQIMDNARKIPALNNKCVTNGTLDIQFLGQ